MNISVKKEIFGRTKRIKIPNEPKSKLENVFAVCVKTDDEKLLVPTKVYKIKLGGNRACVIDESGETAVYPLDFFLVLPLSPAIENKLAEVIG